MAKASNTSNRGNTPVPRSVLSALTAGPAPLMVLTAALLLLFANKAFHVDDTLFVRAAQQIRVDPLHPYSFQFNWVDAPDTFWRATQNPPLTSYMIAGVTLIGGFREWPLHLLFIAMAVGCTGLMYEIARRFCGHPALATAATVLTPAFLVTAGSVMADIPLLFFWLLSIWMALRFLESQRGAWMWGCGLAAAAAAMTKYFGAALVPLLFVYCWPRTRGHRAHLGALLMPVAVLAAWGVYAEHESGIFHPLNAVSYSAGIRETIGDKPLQILGHTVSFLGGGMLWPVALLPLLVLGTQKRQWMILQIVAVAVFSIAMAAYEAKAAGVPWRWLYFCMLLCGAMATLTVIRGLWQTRDRAAILLGLWFFGTIVFCVVFNWTINERIVLPAIFPASILAVRWIEGSANQKLWTTVSACALLPTLALSLVVAAADTEFAAAGRTFAQTTVRRQIQDERRVLFAGHWGFQFYMEQEGAEALDFRRPQLRRGDLLVYPTFHTSGAPPDVPLRIVVDSKNLFANPYGIHTMNGGAGFYSSIFGNVPYAYAEQGLADRFFILEYSAAGPRNR